MIKSVWWVVYKVKDGQPLFFIVKRKAISGKIERVAPKGKMIENESKELTCVREISEETSMDINKLHIKKLLGDTELKNMVFDNDREGKVISYFLVYYEWDRDDPYIRLEEWFTGNYKRADIHTVLNLVPYTDLRNIFRAAYEQVQKDINVQKAMSIID